MEEGKHARPTPCGNGLGTRKRQQGLFPCPLPLGFPSAGLIQPFLENLVDSDPIGKPRDLEAWVCFPSLRPASWVTWAHSSSSSLLHHHPRRSVSPFVKWGC